MDKDHRPACDAELRRLLESAATMLEEAEEDSENPLRAMRWGRLAGEIQAYLDKADKANERLTIDDILRNGLTKGD